MYKSKRQLKQSSRLTPKAVRVINMSQINQRRQKNHMHFCYDIVVGGRNIETATPTK